MEYANKRGLLQTTNSRQRLLPHLVFVFIADNEITRRDVLCVGKLLRVPLSRGKFINHERTLNVLRSVVEQL